MGVAGGVVDESVDPALARLRAFLWTASTATAALAAFVLVDDGQDGEPAAVVLACSATVAVTAGAYWAGRARPLQQATTLIALALAAGALASTLGGGHEVVGLFEDRPRGSSQLMNLVPSLYGKVLVCHCAPC